MASPVIQVRFPEDIVVQIQEEAVLRKVSVSEFVRQTVLQALLAKAALPLNDFDRDSRFSGEVDGVKGSFAGSVPEGDNSVGVSNDARVPQKPRSLSESVPVGDKLQNIKATVPGLVSGDSIDPPRSTGDNRSSRGKGTDKLSNPVKIAEVSRADNSHTVHRRHKFKRLGLDPRQAWCSDCQVKFELPA